MDQHDASTLFLKGIDQPELAVIVSHLLMDINSAVARDGDHEGTLPHNLRIGALTDTIANTGSTSTGTLSMPRVHRVGGMNLADSALDAAIHGIPGYCIQGFDVPRVFFTSGGNRGRRDGPPPGSAPPKRKQSRPSGRFPRPDKRHRFDENVQCDACRRVSHMAISCDMLAICIFIDEYMRDHLNDRQRTQIMDAWMKRHREKLGRPRNGPRQVTRTYMEDLDLSMADIGAQLDWEAWEDSPIDFSFSDDGDAVGETGPDA